MNTYYSTIILFSLANLLLLAVLVRQDGRIREAEKRRFYATYLCIAISTAAEWAAVMLNGAPDWTYGLHVFAKFADYAVTPFAGVLFVRQMGVQSRFERAVNGVILMNVGLEALSCFLGIIFTVDPVTNIHSHGPLNFLYILIFVLSFFYALHGFILYGRQFQRKNQVSIGAIFALVTLGILIQEAVSDELRVINLGLSMACTLAFIHYTAFSQQRIDAEFLRQKRLLDTDVLTGMFSRYAYSENLNRYQEEKTLPEDLAVFAIDVNGLKEVNDTLGHAAGDELIHGAAQCILQVMSPHGKCFRTGGDEFVALLCLPADRVQAIMEELQGTVEAWRGTVVQKLSVSVGYAIRSDSPNASVEMLAGIADSRMYENKAAYYKQIGVDRRRSPR